LAAFNGQLKQDVNFGFGLLGHLDKEAISKLGRQKLSGSLGYDDTSLAMTGKALLFKSVGVQKRENRRDFHQVSDD